MGKGQSNRLILPLVVLVFSLASATAEAETKDPLEPVNRAVFKVNNTADKWVVKPVAKAYRGIMPDFAERGVRHFFSNLGEVRNTVHNLLQGKGKRALRSTGRFAINSTVGVAGLFDVATKLGIDQAREDLGQTLGTWGLGSGPYLVLPLLGPSSLRDSTGLVVDPFLSPETYVNMDLETRLALFGLNKLQQRADLLDSEALLTGDTYTLIREAYLSKREFDIHDGKVEGDSFTDEDSTEDSGDFVDENF